MHRIVIVLIGALVALTAVVPSASAWEPPVGGTFNNPQGTKVAKWRIVNRVNAAINRAPRGSKIYISTYLFDSESSTKAILRAHDRGVQIKIAMDGDDADNRKTRRIANRLNADDVDPKTGEPYLDASGNPLRWGPDNSHLTFCQGSCRGGRADNHAKFYVFSKTGTASNVVMVSSSNLNAGGAVKGWNDLYTVKGRSGMVKTYASILEEMLEDTPAGPDRYRQVTHGPFTSRFFPMTEGIDPVYNDLSRVYCRGANGGAGVNGRTKINISMFYWGGARGEKIARRVVQLGKEGCVVKVTFGAPTKVVSGILRTAAKRGHLKLWDSRYDRNRDGAVDLRVHTKYLLINGRFGSDRSAWLVHTGSQNWGRGSLYYGDENTLTIAKRWAYAQYMKNWNFVRKNGARRIGR